MKVLDWCPCCQEVSEVEFGEGVGHVVRKCQRWSLVKVPAMLVTASC